MATSVIKAVLSRSEFEAMGGLAIDIAVTILSTDWSENAPYTYTWTNNAVTSGSYVEVLFAEGSEESNVSYLEYDKVSGGVQFTSPNRPTVNIPVVIHISHVNSDLAVTGEMVSTNVISGATNVDEALNTLNSNLTMELDSTYSNFFTPASGMSITSCTLRKVTKNIYYLYLEASFSSDVFTDSTLVTIGSMKLSYFDNKPITGGIPGYISKNSTSRPAYIYIRTNADVIVIPTTTVACNSIIANGFIVRREV